MIILHLTDPLLMLNRFFKPNQYLSIINSHHYSLISYIIKAIFNWPWPNLSDSYRLVILRQFIAWIGNLALNSAEIPNPSENTAR